MLFEKFYVTSLSALRNAQHGPTSAGQPRQVNLGGPKNLEDLHFFFRSTNSKKSSSKHPVQLLLLLLIALPALCRYSTGLRASLEIMKPDLQKTKKFVFCTWEFSNCPRPCHQLTRKNSMETGIYQGAGFMMV